MLRQRRLVARRRLAQARSVSAPTGVHPARTVALAFLVLVGIGTLTLMLPGMRADGRRVPLGDALFTSVSASCVTGLAVVDTGTYWSIRGQVAILALIQVGGFGIMTLGTLAALLVSRRIGLQTRLATQAESGTLDLGALRGILAGVAITTVTIEAIVAAGLAARLMLGYGRGFGNALWQGVFHSVSAFNNAGFSTAPDSLTRFRTDVFIIGPISTAIVLGGLGFPVMSEVVRRATSGRSGRRLWRGRATGAVPAPAAALPGSERMAATRQAIDRQGLTGPVPMSLHTRLMLGGTLVLLVVGTVGFALFEWGNTATLAGEPVGQRLFQSFFSGGVTPRTAGFTIVDYAQVRPETRFLTDALMIIGGGSASTAGGIKITTLVVLLLAAAAEVRGSRDVSALDRRLPERTVRIALAVVMVFLVTVMVGTLALLAMTGLDLDLALFEVISAIATVGLSANVTPTLHEPAQLLLVALMFLGRVGPVTLVSALSLRTADRRYRLPEGKPLIG